MTATPRNYALHARLNLPYDQAVERVTAALKEEGFGILTRIDVQATLKAKIGADFRPYVILGACNPHLAYEALQAELEAGLLLPCTVIVYADGEASMVAIVEPTVTLAAPGNPALDAVADEAQARLERVIAALSA